MFLNQLDVSGFKSFGGRAKLSLEPGITAIVGPNGSGKSNIADAIRWALGEQSAKSLRLKKSEELVFVGTDKRARASLAEVKLRLDNHDGRMELDFSEVEITRRLYGSGDSDYLLNGKKVRLTDIQQLLAAAGFGPNSYSVIGQGMIDSFILASPAERKQLFDDASGIRAFEIKREQALRKLSDTEANLIRVGDVLAELEPRLRGLERSVTAASARRELEQELEQHRRRYIATAIKHFTAAARQAATEIKAAETAAGRAARRVAELEARRDKLQSAGAEAAKTREHLAHELTAAEHRRDQVSAQLSGLQADLQIMLTNQEAAAGVPLRIQDFKKQLASGAEARADIDKRLVEARRAEAGLVGEMERITQEISTVQRDLSKRRREADQSSSHEYVTQALLLLKQLARQLGSPQLKPDQLKLMIYKIGRLLSHAHRQGRSPGSDLRQVQAQLTALMNRREEQHERYTSAVILVRSLELDLSYNHDRTAQLQQQLAEAKQALQDMDLPSSADIAKWQKALDATKADQAAIDKAVADLRRQLAADHPAEASEDVFELANGLEAARFELARQQELGEAAKAAAKQAEAELARHHGLAKDQFGGPPKPAEAAAKPLHELERDLSLLESRLASTGAADQEVEAEYAEVKDRYDFLAGQVGDLEAAQADLMKVVGQLDGLIKRRFEEAFRDISEHFGRYFARIFGGGRAKLTLVQQEDQIFGIEIQASPPGKRIQTLAMLSGGERALVGIALLAAILAVNPSPFVVLDEVDAALDEANSARFADILREVAEHSQIIVITHNRQTMSAAKLLYGVTMDEHHVSRLLSVRLEEARALASR